MAYRTILSVIGIDRFEDDLQAAADICGASNAHLSALVVKLAAPPPPRVARPSTASGWESGPGAVRPMPRGTCAAGGASSLSKRRPGTAKHGPARGSAGP